MPKKPHGFGSSDPRRRRRSTRFHAASDVVSPRHRAIYSVAYTFSHTMVSRDFSICTHLQFLRFRRLHVSVTGAGSKPNPLKTHGRDKLDARLPGKWFDAPAVWRVWNAFPILRNVIVCVFYSSRQWRNTEYNDNNNSRSFALSKYLIFASRVARATLVQHVSGNYNIIIHGVDNDRIRLRIYIYIYYNV